jgi:tetratricopeptide (TPR) repeat protein
MESFLPSYRDPLFSILLILCIVLVISILTYGWGIYKKQKEQEALHRFLDRFDSSECSLDTDGMPYQEYMLKPLTLLAKAFDTSGEYQKSINIYIYLIKHIDDRDMKDKLLRMLGNTYLHAGFLQRAESIYLEILERKPRTIQVLYELGVVYEMMHSYQKALETITPLNLLGEDTELLLKHLKLLSIINNHQLETKEKIELLVDLITQDSTLYRESIKALFALDTYRAWQLVDMDRLEEILDILWFLPNSQLDLDIISSDMRLSSIYYAKGYTPKVSTKSGIFVVDVLCRAKESGCDDATLTFSYLCSNCKHSFPISFSRCPNCMAINSIKVEEQIGKATTKRDYSIF